MSSMNTVVVSIPSEDRDSFQGKKKSNQFSILKKKGAYDPKQVIHSIKVGIALVLVSLLYLVNPLYDQVGENAMWAIMTVVVIFENYAGATLSKGLNRGMGTVLGGGMGCLVAIIAQEVGGIDNAISIGTSVFIFGAAASYFRMVPSIKRRYDYGVLVFILTFNLVVVSGVRGLQVIQLARERLETISMGFIICVLINLLIFPSWASNELHLAIVKEFNILASSIEGCLEAYFRMVDEKKEAEVFTNINGYKSVLNSKTRDQTLANFARWEPWHKKFGFNHPWEKYLSTGELLRELAASIVPLKGCLQSSHQSSSIPLRLYVKEPCEALASMLTCTLGELGNSIMDMRKFRRGGLNLSKLQSLKLELTKATSSLCTLTGTDGFEVQSFVFFLTDITSKVENLAKEVEELGDLAGFCPEEPVKCAGNLQM